MSASLSAEVAIVGGGPAGAALAIELATCGHEVVLFERRARPQWRACGVYSSALARRRLATLGVPDTELNALTRPIGAMVLQQLGGEAVRLEYPAPYHSAGFDRPGLDGTLLAAARAAGAQVREGAIVRAVDLLASGPTRVRRTRLLASEGGESNWWDAGLLVGADGPRSLVARSAGVARDGRFRRAGVTLHHADPAAAAPGQPMDAHFYFGNGWYCGVAPVPGGRVNIGIVLTGAQLRSELRRPGGVAGVAARTIAALPAAEWRWQSAPPVDEPRVQLPLAHRTSCASGPGFMLVGDAAGFIDPLSGEGLHRALLSASLAAAAIGAWSRGDRSALSDYDHHLRARFRNKDVVSWVLQAFVTQPALLGHALRRLNLRPRESRTFTLALADLVPASRILDPRFLGRLLLT